MLYQVSVKSHCCCARVLLHVIVVVPGFWYKLLFSIGGPAFCYQLQPVFCYKILVVGRVSVTRYWRLAKLSAASHCHWCARFLSLVTICQYTIPVVTAPGFIPGEYM